MSAEALATGRVTQVIGPAIDVEFPAGQLPDLLTALTISNPNIDDKEDNKVQFPVDVWFEEIVKQGKFYFTKKGGSGRR